MTVLLTGKYLESWTTWKEKTFLKEKFHDIYLSTWLLGTAIITQFLTDQIESYLQMFHSYGWLTVITRIHSHQVNA